MAIFEAIKVGAFVIVGLAIGWVASSTYAGLVTVPAAREAGRAEEHKVHEEQRRKAEVKARADRDAAQATIDQVEQDYFECDKALALEMSALEQALQEERENAPTPTSAGRALVCRPAVPRRVRDALDRVGRPVNRSPAAVPHAAVP